MSAVINPARVAAQAYIRPVPQPIRTGFSVGDEAPVKRARETIVSGRRVAPAVQITLSPEALDLLAKSRFELNESRTPDANAGNAPSEDGARSNVKPATGDQRNYQRPGSQVDITL